jgi:hypothetical protein
MGKIQCSRYSRASLFFFPFLLLSIYSQNPIVKGFLRHLKEFFWGQGQQKQAALKLVFADLSYQGNDIVFRFIIEYSS